MHKKLSVLAFYSFLMLVLSLLVLPSAFAVTNTVTIQTKFVGQRPANLPTWYYNNGTVSTQPNLQEQISPNAGSILYPIVSSTSGNSLEQFSAIPLTYGLVGYWPLDEGSGSSAYDLSGNQNTGTLVNSPQWLSDPNCKFGNCVNFTASLNQEINIPVPSFMKTSNPSFSIGFYYYLKNWCPQYFCGIQIGTTNQHMEIRFMENVSGSYIAAQVTYYGNNDINNFTASSTPKPNLNTWYYEIVTWNGTGITQFIDGTNQGGVNVISGSPDYTPGFSGYIQLGRFGNTMNGALDNVELWNYALNASEARENYQSAMPVIEHSVSNGASYSATYYSQNTTSLSTSQNYASLGQPLSSGSVSGIYWVDYNPAQALSLIFVMFFLGIIFIMGIFSLKLKNKLMPVLTIIFTASVIAYITPNYSYVSIDSSTIPIDLITLSFILFGMVFSLLIFLTNRNRRY